MEQKVPLWNYLNKKANIFSHNYFTVKVDNWYVADVKYYIVLN